MKKIPGTTSKTPWIMKENDTAGFTCPPEISPKTKTIVDKASQWANPTIINDDFPASAYNTAAHTEKTKIIVPTNSAATYLQLTVLNSPISILNDLGIRFIII